MVEIQLRVGAFTPSVVVDVARRSGRLSRAGIDLLETPVASSPAQFRSLERGEIDVAITSPDNVLAYRFLSSNPLGRNFPVAILAALDRGLGLSICLSPEITSIEDVRGKSVGVDVPDSGFAFVAYALLERAGLHPGEYSVEALGSTPLRASALAESRCAASVLGAGNELRAQAKGCNIVAPVTDLGPYIGSVLAASESSDRTIRDGRRRFAGVLLETAQEIMEGGREAEVVESAMATLNLTESEAQAHYRRVLALSTGLIPDGVADRESIAVLLELRRRYLPTPQLDRLEEEYSSMFSR
jgi:ABC-type nitrate/sulfonate/bicarbonate transport system substrate-binding protein